MKLKRPALFCLILITAIALCACEGASGDKEMPAPDTVAQAILEQVTFRDSMIRAEGDVAANYYKLDDTVAEHAIYISGSGATAEEIAVLKISDSKNLDSARSILEKRIDEQKRKFEAYVPGEMVKLESPVIITKGDLAILVISDDSSGAESVIKDALS